MRHIYLRAVNDPNAGEMGFILDGFQVADDYDSGMNADTTGLNIAHDIMEHMNGPARIGGVVDELQALGAIWYIRGQFGDMRRGGQDYHAPEVHIASDVSRMFWVVMNSGENYHVPRRTNTSEIDDTLRDVIDRAMKGICDEAESYDHIQEWRHEMAPYLTAAYQWMRVGWRKAKARYGDAQRANRQFWAINDAVNKALKHVEYEGQRFMLSYANGEATCRELYDDDQAD